MEVLAEGVEFFVEADVLECQEAFFIAHVQVFLAVSFKDSLGCFDDVLSMVAVFRDFCVVAAELEVSGIDGFSEMVDLVACVVDVVFGIDVIAGSAEQVHHSGTVCCASGMADVKRACRVGGNVFHEDSVLLVFRKVPVGRACLQDFFQFGIDGVCCQEEIDEPCACDIHLGNKGRVDMFHDHFRDLARRSVRCFCPAHGSIGGIIAEFLGLRDFQTLHGGVFPFRQLACRNGGVLCFFNDFLQLFSDFHEYSGSSRTSITTSFKWLNSPLSSTS